MRKSSWLGLVVSGFVAAGCLPQSGGYGQPNLVNVKQLAVSMALYLSDSDDVFPYVEDREDLKLLLYPYQRTESLWEFRDTKNNFNQAFSGVKSTNLDEPEHVVIFYADRSQANGKRVVAFVNTAARTVDDVTWSKWEFTLYFEYPKAAKLFKANRSTEYLLAMAMQMYVSGGRFPNAVGPAGMRALLAPYCGSAGQWTPPVKPGYEFLYNSSLAGALSEDIKHPDKTLLFYENKFEADGKRRVAFVDGSVAALDAKGWGKVEPSLHMKFAPWMTAAPAVN